MNKALNKPKDFDEENLKVAFEPSPTAVTSWHPDQQIIPDQCTLTSAISKLNSSHPKD